MAGTKSKRKKQQPKKGGGKKPKAKAESGDGGSGRTMHRVSTNDERNEACGYYISGKSASRATGCNSDQCVTNALNRTAKSKKGKGVVGQQDKFIVERIENCTEPEGPTLFGQQDGKWKMADHAPGPGSGSNNSRIGITLGRCLNSSKEKIPNDTEGRTFGDVIKGVASKHGVQRHGFVIYDGDMFAKIMAWEKSTIGSKLAKLKKKGSNKKSRRLDNGKKGSFPQFWYVDGLKRGLDDYTVFALS